MNKKDIYKEKNYNYYSHIRHELIQMVEGGGNKILDIGCGTYPYFLARTYFNQKFAIDQIPPKQAKGDIQWATIDLNNQPTLPYADDYFDAVISVDAYEYFGESESYMDEKLAPLVKKGGIIAIAVPGVKNELNGACPLEMSYSWTAEDLTSFHSCEWWRELLSKSKKIEIESVSEMQGFDEFWNDWLACDNEYAVRDRPAMEAGAGKYMNFVSIIAKKK